MFHAKYTTFERGSLFKQKIKTWTKIHTLKIHLFSLKVFSLWQNPMYSFKASTSVSFLKFLYFWDISDIQALNVNYTHRHSPQRALWKKMADNFRYRKQSESSNKLKELSPCMLMDKWLTGKTPWPRWFGTSRRNWKGWSRSKNTSLRQTLN